jgi:DNA-directed RNA polymerase subunit RPC12/RpoP
MTRLDQWHVKFDLTPDGEEVRWDDLDECTQEHIAECVKESYTGGEIVMEMEEDYNGKIIHCPYCGKEITIGFNTARCEECGWSAMDADLDEIMNP